MATGLDQTVDLSTWGQAALVGEGMAQRSERLLAVQLGALDWIKLDTINFPFSAILVGGGEP